MSDGVESFHAPEFCAYDFLRNPDRNTTAPIELSISEEKRFSGTRAHFGHLAYKSYRDYMQMHKVIVRSDGAKKLERLGEDLDREKFPVLLDAAGWAFAESAIADNKSSIEHRLHNIERAEESWTRALSAHDSIVSTVLEETIHDEDTPYRLALNLAFTPLMREIISEGVTQETVDRTLGNVLNIAELVAVQTNLAFKQGKSERICELSGLTHECNALLSLLYISNLVYIPIPSTARADSGYYHTSQTHDISLINHHWNHIKRTVPIEVKKSPSRADRNRYKAIILTKRDLVYEPHASAYSTVRAFSGVYSGEATDKDKYIVEKVTNRVKRRLAEYQDRPVAKMPFRHTPTKFNEPSKEQILGVAAFKSVA